MSVYVKHKDFNRRWHTDRGLGKLIKPELQPQQDAFSDADMYAAVRAYGEAVIKTQKGSEILTPEQFEAEWMGD